MTTFVGPDSIYFEPPDPEPECGTCDGEGTVWVLTVPSTDGQVHNIQGEAKDIKCPRCNGEGVEPPYDPLEDPRIP